MSINSVTISHCRLCNSSDLENVLDLGNQPLANSLRQIESLPNELFPLIICRCGKCGTIQLTETVSPDILFDHYVWVTGTSEGARIYSHIFKDSVLSRINSDPKFIVEIASNDGTFLKPFQRIGIKVLGVDPAKNIAQMAVDEGIPTLPLFFGLQAAQKIIHDHGKADIVFARNVIPHVANAKDVVAGIAELLQLNGTGIIEFHRADIILEELHYDSIYHEHLFYHSIHSMTILLNQFGLIPYDLTESPISGGSYALYFSHVRKPVSEAFTNAVLRETHLGTGKLSSWQDFATACNAHKTKLLHMIQAYKNQGNKIIGYGASARSSTMLNYCGIDGQYLECVADRAELKHGKLTPGTDLMIVSPSDAFLAKPDIILLLAWNFKDEILNQIQNEFGWSGDVIIPLPNDPEVVRV
jgi:hypothetical protein